MNKTSSSFKLKAKFTMQVSDKQGENTLARSHNKKNKTFRAQPVSNQQSNEFDGKVVKSIIQVKIQQLHRKMKDFFKQQRQHRIDNFQPEIENLKNQIMNLRKQLSKPKSVQEIQNEKRELLQRKAILLNDMQNISKKLKQNKNILCDLKFQHQQVDRQLNNGILTVQKYKKKMRVAQKSCSHEKGQEYLSEEKDNQGDNNDVKKVRHDSVLEDAIHMTQINCISKQNKQNLPAINQKINKKINDQNTGLISLNSNTKQKQEANPSSLNMIFKENKIKSNTMLQYLTCNRQLKQSKNELSYFNSQRNTLRKTNLKSITNKNYEFDLTMEMRKYQQLVNKEKWKKVDELFRDLETTQNQSNHIEKLQQLLVDELRKKQFSRFQEKGYHEGLKSKTHQIKLQLKKVFKNYSADQFFDQVVKKKVVKKTLGQILEYLMK